PLTSIEIVTTTCVGIVGALAFVRHVVFHRSDAERLGWQTERPDWQFEVGFANLAFAIMGGLAAFGSSDFKVHGVVLLGYAVYLFQAAMLHLCRHVTGEKSSAARLWRSVVPTLLYAGMMTFFALFALRF
ncbi:MAG: hypothetical protein NTY01_23905, partial [Verrucomicrobia bacterium]|nr:hypothetical protein [Verrucomicrobiota bacterium]